jgi:dehydrogenase/reductase SDR family member 7B
LTAFTNKVAIVTGATSGIGKAVAIELARQGCKVSICGRDPERLAEAKRELLKFTPDIIAASADVESEEDCKRLIAETTDKFGGLDILINNAGISMRALFSDTRIEVIRKVMGINFWGTVYCSHYAIPHLIQSRGTLVGISSIAGIRGLPGRSAYSASKFAMHGLLQSIRSENRKTGLQVLICCPGFTASNIRNTALTGDGLMQSETPRDEDKMMQPEEVALRLVKAIQKKRKTLILTPSGKMTSLISKIFPFWLDKQIYKHLAEEPNAPFR